MLDDLEKVYGRPAPPRVTDPLELVLWENVAYLVNDDQRRVAFEALRERVGLEPERILAAAPETLRDIATLGGILPDQRVGKLLKIAEIAKRHFRGGLRGVVRRPLPEARKALMRFPSIGEPGADKILLFSGSHPVLAFDSNALRVLVRLGFGGEKKSYAATYRSAQEAVKSKLKRSCAWLVRAHQLLRRHGLELCRRREPRCEVCPVRGRCAYYRRGRPGPAPFGFSPTSLGRK